jgi:hypothetical protein
MSNERSGSAGSQGRWRAQFIVVSKRGAKPVGTCSAQNRRATGISCA